MTGSLKPKIYQCYIRKKSKNAYKKRKNENFEKQKNVFLSHVPRIIQPKNQVPRPKGVPCSPSTDRHTHTQSDYCGHPFKVSGFFSINLSSRIGPIKNDRFFKSDLERRYAVLCMCHKLVADRHCIQTLSPPDLSLGKNARKKYVN